MCIRDRSIFKGLLRQAGVAYEDSKKVSMELTIDSKIEGTYDIIMDDAVDDIKSASDWSYRNKFESFDTLAKEDPFGYVGQLAGYAQALNKKAGGWWVINKANGSFKYVPATGLDLTKEVDKLSDNVSVVQSIKFKRCFDAVDETFNGKPTGNKILDTECSWCSFRKTCWPELKELPALKSRAKEPKIVSYVHIEKESRA